MEFLKYEEYLLEKKIYDLLLESKVVFSVQFLRLLNSIVKLSPQNKIAPELIKLYSKDYDVVQNYIDLTDTKDTVSFTPDRKVKELINKEGEELWEVTDSGRYLTHSSSNDRIFNLLGYEKPEEGEPYQPTVGTLGTILNEVVSPVSSKVFVIFQSESGKQTVLNKEALKLQGEDDRIVWSSSRNNIKVGRLARALLTAAAVEFTDKDIEDFTNSFKSTFDYLSDKLIQFKLVKGEEIKKWYWHERYKSGNGTMNNSCMSEVDSDFFDIYSKNSNCSLLILFDDNGQIGENGYESNKIKGRAIVWDCLVNGKNEIFMDRIYTVNDSDVELFKQYATSKNWFHKKYQDMDQDCNLVRGNEQIDSPRIEVSLQSARLDYYPYCDTLSYLYMDDKKLMNREEDENDDSCDRTLRCTDGEYE